MAAPHGSGCETVKFGSFSLATLGGISHDSLMKTPTLSINCVGFLALLLLGCVALLPTAQAVNPPPDGDYPGRNTAEGQAALFSLTSGAYNAVVGWLSLNSVDTGNFNTAIGAATLFANTADQNTATGAGALLSNFTGSQNTANGTFALYYNLDGSNNTAIGDTALAHNTTGQREHRLGPGSRV